MRILIFKRRKTFTASFGKLSVFIQDSRGDFEIRGIKCKEIGKLKNGDKGEYTIPNESVHIFTVVSKSCPEWHHANYMIPAGDETVELFVGPKLNPAGGNPFSIYDKKDMVEHSKERGW